MKLGLLGLNLVCLQGRFRASLKDSTKFPDKDCDKVKKEGPPGAGAVTPSQRLKDVGSGGERVGGIVIVIHK